MKNSTVFGSLPEITYEGVVMNQSKAALRAIGIKLGYYESRAEVAYAIDSLVDFNEEILNKIV